MQAGGQRFKSVHLHHFIYLSERRSEVRVQKSDKNPIKDIRQKTSKRKLFFENYTAKKTTTISKKLEIGKIKLIRAYGGCLGAKRRRRAW